MSLSINAIAGITQMGIRVLSSDVSNEVWFGLVWFGKYLTSLCYLKVISNLINRFITIMIYCNITFLMQTCYHRKHSMNELLVIEYTFCSSNCYLKRFGHKYVKYQR